MICKNLQQIREAINISAKSCGRDPQAISLVAVSKRKPIEDIKEAVTCGHAIFGENYLQESGEKIPQLSASLNWHFIGHLQSNKAKQAVELFDVIETVDRLKIARALDKHSRALNKKISILIQVNIGREQQKSGILPEEVEKLAHSIREETQLNLMGLMAMPPFSRDPEKSRPFFRELRSLAITLAERKLFSDNSQVELSMGMSGDFKVAIEEGATLIRIGTAIFGDRI